MDNSARSLVYCEALGAQSSAVSTAFSFVKITGEMLSFNSRWKTLNS